VIRHSISEATGLLRQRALIGLALAAALAVPIALGGLTLFLGSWLRPYVGHGQPTVIVEVLLRPELDPGERSAWIHDVAEHHPDWKLREVPPQDLAARLSRWFPYLQGLMQNGNEELLPPLVEVRAPEPDQVTLLARDPKVLAVGPTTSLRRAVERAGRRIAAGLLGLTVVLLLASLLLAAVWTHLEIYRHADEITIQRLVGATEAAVRGPFLAVICVMGAVAGLLAAGGTLLMVHEVQDMARTLGLPQPRLAPWIPVLQIMLAVLLPLGSAWIALARHSELNLD